MPSSLNQDDIGGAGRLARFDWQVFRGFHNRSCYQSARCSHPRFKHSELFVASFGAGSLIDVFFCTNRKSSALNFFARLTQRFKTSAETHPCQTPRGPENDEIKSKGFRKDLAASSFDLCQKTPHPADTSRDVLRHSLPATR